jgi:hypothetical protein
MAGVNKLMALYNTGWVALILVASKNTAARFSEGITCMYPIEQWYRGNTV